MIAFVQTYFPIILRFELDQNTSKLLIEYLRAIIIFLIKIEKLSVIYTIQMFIHSHSNEISVLLHGWMNVFRFYVFITVFSHTRTMRG